jgi:translation initiation factor 4E
LSISADPIRSGGKFTLRLAHPVTPLLFESLLLALIGDQFDEADCVVGCVLSVRQAEDILSVWVEEEGEGVRSGALR